MTTKISELPLDTDYILNDYIPIVDSAGLITNRIRMSTLVTGSYGLSASFITLNGGGLGTGQNIRLGGSSATSLISWVPDGVTDRAWLSSDGSGKWIVGAAGSQYGSMRAYTLDFEAWTTMTFTGENFGYTYLTMTPAEGSKFTQPVTASVGVSGSLVVPTSGHIRTTLADNVTTIPVYSYSSDSATETFGDTTGAAYTTEFFANNYGYMGNTVAGTFFISNAAAPELSGYIGFNQVYNVGAFGSNFYVPLTASLGLRVEGATEASFAQSGSIINSYDRYLSAREDRATEATTPGSPSKAIFTYVSGTNGKTYLVDTIVTAQSTTTTGSLAFKLTGHYYMTGGVIGVVDAPYTILESVNHAHLTASLTSSAGNIIVSGTQGASAESFQWGCFVRVQEQGSA